MLSLAVYGKPDEELLSQLWKKYASAGEFLCYGGLLFLLFLVLVLPSLLLLFFLLHANSILLRKLIAVRPRALDLRIP